MVSPARWYPHLRPSGLGSTVIVVSLGGATDTDIETDSELLARLLDVMCQPAACGNAHDHKIWVQSVGGVSGAWVFPLRRDLGTVDVVIAATSDLPSAKTIVVFQTYIDSVRPITAKDCQVLAPTVKTVDVTVAVGSVSATTRRLKPS